MDSIGIIGLVTGLWFALSPAEEQSRPPSAWLGWLLAGTCAVLLLAGTMTEPLAPRADSDVTADWTTAPVSDSPQQSGLGGTGNSQVARAGPTAQAG